nr:putative reverse transcriptase domain-containing protein [Tanacetum cinerariifolium]
WAAAAMAVMPRMLCRGCRGGVVAAAGGSVVAAAGVWGSRWRCGGVVVVVVPAAIGQRRLELPVLWVEIRESRLIRPESVQETADKVVLIKEKLKATRDRQKSYADNRRKPLEFEVRDQVLLKVSPYKGVIRFRREGKLAPIVHVPLDEIKVDKTLCFVEEPVEIMDQEVKSLKRSTISIDKVR